MEPSGKQRNGREVDHVTLGKNCRREEAVAAVGRNREQLRDSARDKDEWRALLNALRFRFGATRSQVFRHQSATPGRHRSAVIPPDRSSSEIKKVFAHYKIKM